MANELNWEKDGVYWKYTGEVSGMEVMNACVSIYGDPRFDTLKYKLSDFADVKSMSITDADLKKIAFQDKAAELSNPYVKSAIVMTLESHLGEKFASYFDDSNWEVEVFPNMDLANKWLGRNAA